MNKDKLKVAIHYVIFEANERGISLDEERISAIILRAENYAYDCLGRPMTGAQFIKKTDK